MNIVIGSIILLAVLLVATLLALFFMPTKKIVAKKTVAVPKIEKRRKAPTPEFKTSSTGEVLIPKEIPRTIETIKVIAEESPDLVASIIRGWLLEKG